MSDQLEVRSPEGEPLDPAPGSFRSRNRLLGALPPEEWELLRPHLHAVELEVMEVIGEVGEPLRSLYFPETGVISMVRRMRDGTIVEAGTVGREGVAGVLVLLDEPTLPATLLGEVPGRALRIELEAMRELTPRLPTFTELHRRYLITVLNQIGQSAACNTQHTVEQRCARWLLTTHDQVGSDEFLLTHEVLSQMLAVRRAGVTEAAGALQHAGLISYRRGRVTIVDRAGLEGVTCECHGVIRAHYERILGIRAPLPDASRA
jgi:CRP-like cAMP-binding protein